ncbi:MAG: 30S ribosomal protein S8 [Anaerolineaceae bacterium]
MSINDPISDMLTRIRNGVASNQTVVAIPASKMKAEIARILKEEGFILGYEIVDGPKIPQKILRVNLKYIGDRRERRAVITGIVRISKPGRRIYTHKKEIPWVRSGMGVAILSTPKGIMTGQEAQKSGLGGEILCKVW